MGLLFAMMLEQFQASSHPCRVESSEKPLSYHWSQWGRAAYVKGTGESVKDEAVALPGALEEGGGKQK